MAYQPISISQAQKDDLVSILNLFDEAVVWLCQRGLEKQWGTEPFSTLPKRREQFMKWIEQEIMFVARLNERIVGSLALNPLAPWYIAARWEHFPSSAFYLEGFATSRAFIGQGIGRILLQWAEQYTCECGRTTIWLDCWGENALLVRYYQQMGFTTHGTFMVKEWQGQLFEKQIVQAE